MRELKSDDTRYSKKKLFPCCAQIGMTRNRLMLSKLKISVEVIAVFLNARIRIN